MKWKLVTQPNVMETNLFMLEGYNYKMQGEQVPYMIEPITCVTNLCVNILDDNAVMTDNALYETYLEIEQYIMSHLMN